MTPTPFHRPLSMALCALGALGLSACPGDPPAVGCKGADDCLVGQVCVDSKCVVPPDASAAQAPDSGSTGACSPACATDEKCLSGQCFRQMCEEAACRSGEVCKDGWCVTEACAPVSCGSGKVCQDGACVSTDCNGVVCDSGLACKDGTCIDELCLKVACQGSQVCVAGLCVETACASGACPSGQVCWEGLCTDTRCVDARCPEGTLCQAGSCIGVPDAGAPARRDAGPPVHADGGGVTAPDAAAAVPDGGALVRPDGSVAAGPDAGTLRPDAASPGADAGPSCGADCAPFSVILLPDTQYYTSKQAAGAANTYYKQTQWIVDHRTTNNIKFVIHLGDITGSNQDSQWPVADGAHKKLDTAGIPYSMLPGNHDYMVSGQDWARGNTQFNTWFGPSRFAGKPWYGGHYGSGNENNYTLFEVGPMKFMVISLEYGPRKEPLCWAESVIAAHPDRRVIIASHCIQTNGGGFSGGCPNTDYLVPGGNGQTIWDELARRHSNVFLMVSGHVNDSEHKFAAAIPGQTIHKILTDYQMEAACTLSSASACTNHCQAGTYTGNGWMRELIFKPLENRVYARTFTVEEGNSGVFPGGKPAFFCTSDYPQSPAAIDHQFDFAYDLSTSSPDVRDDGGKLAFMDMTANSVGAGDQLAPVLGMTAAGGFVLAWEDDSSSADGAGNHDIMVRGFSPGGCQSFAQKAANAVTAGQQRLPALGVAGDGRFAVAWEDDNDANGSFQIYARGFDPDGSERFPSLTVNATAAGQQRNPSLAMAPDGRFVVAYEDDQDGDNNFQVRLRGFTTLGAQSFADRSAHDDALGMRARPSVAMAADGSFVVAWEDDSDANGSYQIHARGFAADGTPRWQRIVVNTVSTGQQRKPAVAADSLGGFVVAWQDDQDNDGNYNILARGFEPAGTQRIADFPAHVVLGGQHLNPTVAMAPTGGFVIGWQDDADSNGTYQIRARAFSPTGVEKKAEFTINRFASGQQRLPVVGFAAGGRLVSAWEDDMDGNGSYQILAGGDDLAGF